MAQFYLKYNDNLPTLRSNLSDANGYIDLTTATNVKFIYQLRSRITTPTTGSATILGTTSGYVEWIWPTGSPVSGGFYNGEWRVNFSNGDILSVPNTEYIEFFINNNLR